MEYVNVIEQLAKAIAWPVVVFLLAVLFRPQLVAILGQVQTLLGKIKKVQHTKGDATTVIETTIDQTMAKVGIIQEKLESAGPDEKLQLTRKLEDAHAQIAALQIVRTRVIDALPPASLPDVRSAYFETTRSRDIELVLERMAKHIGVDEIRSRHGPTVLHWIQIELTKLTAQIAKERQIVDAEGKRLFDIADITLLRESGMLGLDYIASGRTAIELHRTAARLGT